VFTIVAGTGYTGRRVLDALPVGCSAGLDSTSMNLDAGARLPVELPSRFAVLYTVPPADDDNSRLRHFLSELSASPRRFVYISTTGVYGDCQGATVTEASPVNPGSGMSRPRVAAENLLANWATRTDCDLVILRAPGIYGPGRLGIERMADGGAVLDEADASPGNRIHVDDLATCCIAALREDTPAGIYNVGDGDHRSSTWFAREVARQAGLPEPRQISRAQAEKEFSAVRLAFLSSSRIVDTTKMREVLGVTPRYSNPEEGIRASLDAQLRL
jgi:nucleoside-diphosphate-sugar epimerase